MVVINVKGKVLGRRQFPNSAEGFRELRSFGRRWRARTWAIEGCNGVGKHLAQRLIAADERVVDVSTRRAALVRVFAGGNGRKNDDVDAHSIALVGLHTRTCPRFVRMTAARRCDCWPTDARSWSTCAPSA